MTAFTDFGDVPLFRYGCILADPPWCFENYSEKGEVKNPVAHYDCMEAGDLAGIHVGHIAAPDCALFLWATAPMLPEALATMGAWGFKFKSAGAWIKRSKSGDKLAFGTGYIWRSAVEFLLVGVNGAPAWRTRSERNVIEAPIRQHSRKPDETYRKIEAMVAGPRVELFARVERDGWDAWGNQVGKFGADRDPGFHRDQRLGDWSDDEPDVPGG